MKKTLLLLASALLFAGCAKEQYADKVEGGLQEVTFTASLDSGVATRAAVDGDGNAANVNRCIMEIYYGDELFARQYAPVNDQKKASFTAQVVSNRTYKVAFWADKVDDATTDEGLATDKYYTTTSLKEIALNGAYVGNDDARDAFFVCEDYQIQQAGGAFEATLKRPFAQMNVITTDWDKVITVAALKPEKVDVTIKNPMVKFNAVTGEASADAGTQTLHYTADLYTAPAPTGAAPATDKTLSMDYLFASSSKALIDIDWKALHGTDADVEHAFAAVPYQRNYRTNIKGALLTTQGQWTVEVVPTWENPDYNVPYYVASSIQDAQNYISSQNTEQAKAVDLSNVVPTTGDFDPDAEDKTIKFVLKTTSPVNLVNFTLPAIPQSVIEAGCTGWKIEHETNYPTQNVGINAPEGTRVVIDAPNSHVTVTGTSYAEIIGTTGENTLVIPQGVSVESLTIAKGGLEIHGTVAAASVTGTTSNVFVRECENLSQGVYDALKDYIAPNYKGTQNTDGSWNIALEDVWPNFAAEEFSAIDQSGKTLTISTPVELALLAKNINAGTSYAGYTISISGNLDMSAHYWVPINAYNGYLSGATIKGDGNTAISNLKINKCVNNNTSGYNYYSGFIGQTVGKLTFKDLTFSDADVKVDNGSGIAVVLGLTYSDVLFDNVKVMNSIVSSNTKVGALLGFTGGDGEKATVKNCTLENVTVKAAYSYALMVGLINVRDQVVFEGNNVVDNNTHAVYDEVVGHEEEDIEEIIDIKGYTYGIDGSKLWVIGVKDAWTEVRTSPTPKKTINNVEYSVYGDVFYHADGVVVDVCAPDPVAQIGDTKYNTLAEAVAAAQDGQTVEIIMADEYTVPGISKNITIKGAVEGVVFNCVGSGSIASIPNGCTFENVSFKMGSGNYHGFQHAGTLNMKDCTFEGLFFSYGDMNFTGCTFNQTASDYCMWDYGQDLTYTNCTFNCAGKFINVYNEGNGNWKLTVEGCTFNSTSKNKAALNIKASCGTTNLGWKVSIKNCSVNDESMFPAASGDAESALFVGSALWQVDDRTSSSLEANIVSVKVDEVLVYGPEF